MASSGSTPLSNFKDPMASEEGSPYQGELFPCDYTVLYCPYDTCPLERPFKQALDLLEHLETAHRTRIVDNSAVIPIFERYLKAVKEKKLLQEPSAESRLELSSTVDGDIRLSLQHQKLEEVLAIQAKERAGLYRRPRQCLFCMEFASDHKDLFTHMFNSHGFNIGLLDNLVMVDEFLKTLEDILMKNVCIFCHSQFRNTGCLRKHMKNKRHYKIDPKNHYYDKYYVVNYLKCGVLGCDPMEKDEKEVPGEGEEADNWDDLDETVDLRTTCLFCEQVFASPNDELIAHCLAAHDFDMERLRTEFSKGQFYDYIKLITYIRHHVKDLCCPICTASFKEPVELEEHMRAEGHCKVPERSRWDQPQYLFPIFDDDPLLFFFDDDNVDEAGT